jgi:hypothetical protein
MESIDAQRARELAGIESELAKAEAEAKLRRTTTEQSRMSAREEAEAQRLRDRAEMIMRYFEGGM